MCEEVSTGSSRASTLSAATFILLVMIVELHGQTAGIPNRPPRGSAPKEIAGTQKRTCVRERSSAQPALLFHSPERAHAKPRESQREANCNQNPPSRRASCLVFLILTRHCKSAEHRHGQEHRARHFQPQHVRHVPKRPCGRARPLPHSVPDAAPR